MQMNFCRRCGQPLTHIKDHVYRCPNKHTLFANSSPAASIVLINSSKEVLLGIRSIEPHKGAFDIPGGFCDNQETAERAVVREVQEELSLSEERYDRIRFLNTAIDIYPYQNEELCVLTSCFYAFIKPGATPTPQDDIGDIVWLSYNDIPFDKIVFSSAVRSLQQLHELKLI